MEITQIEPKTFKRLMDEVRQFKQIPKKDDSSPFRVHIVNNLQNEIVSYGCILLHKPDEGDTKVLVVKRRDSVDYSSFIRGEYTLASLPLLVFGITKSERERLKEGKWSFDELFKDLYYSPNEESETYKIAKAKFEENLQLVLHLFNVIPVSEISEKNLWIFPKGRQNYNNNMKEDAFECAHREFEEETFGNRLDGCQFLNKIIDERFNALNSKIYKSTYFIAKSKELLQIKKIKGERSLIKDLPITEIGEVAWITLEEAKHKLVPRKVHILEEVSKYINM